MLRNVFKWAIVLCVLAFFLSSCESFRPVQDSYAKTDRNRTPERKSEEPSKKSRTSRPSTGEDQVRMKLVRQARRQLGVKYRYGGKTPRGFDCSGYTSYVYQQENIPLSPGSSAQAASGEKVRWQETQAGDLLFFSKNGRRGKVSHVAMVVENSGEELVVIHCTSSKGVMEQDVLRSSYWMPKLLFARDVITEFSENRLSSRR